MTKRIALMASALSAAFLLGACGVTQSEYKAGKGQSGDLIEGVYPASQADCPKGSVYKVNPRWADESSTGASPNVFRWCEVS